MKMNGFNTVGLKKTKNEKSGKPPLKAPDFAVTFNRTHAVWFWAFPFYNGQNQIIIAEESIND